MQGHVHKRLVRLPRYCVVSQPRTNRRACGLERLFRFRNYFFFLAVFFFAAFFAFFAFFAIMPSRCCLEGGAENQHTRKQITPKGLNFIDGSARVSRCGSPK